MIRQTLRRLQRTWGGSAKDSRSDLLSAEVFRRLLARERARTDRNHDPFSLLTFAARSRGDETRLFAVLTEVFGDRLRNTDESGWLDDHRIGVVLPSTPAGGAWKLAEDLLAMLPPDFAAPYCYPWDDDEEESIASADDTPADQPTVKSPARKPVRSLEPTFAVATPLWKRAIDISGAFAVLAAAALPMTLIAAVIKATSPGPVLFRQWRRGLGGRPFAMLKFRTMIDGADDQKGALRTISEQDGPAFKLRKDPRVTRVGRFLRVTSLDELPQLWNVLVGHMSLVGPRPLPVDEADGCAAWQRRRLDVAPGLTCFWQVESRNQCSFEQWMRLDRRYTARRSLWTDLVLLAKTVPAVLSRRGAQ
jgi:lipopolysaccharide/colanic/teichoic acid biosynthesis glycosyltransferase